MEKEIVSEKKDKPAYDEQTLAHLLEAAYVLQEHNSGPRKAKELHPEPLAQAAESEKSIENLPPLPPVAAAAEIAAKQVSPAEPSKDDYTLTLAQIVQIQHQIQTHHLELSAAMSLVADRVSEIAHADGSAVAILQGNNVTYPAVSGKMTLPEGTEVPLEKALCAASLKTGHVIRCGQLNAEFLVDPLECSRRGIQSLIAVPVFHEGGIAGSLELYYSRAEAFTEQDVHTCQLMAGLITEALARADEVNWKKSLANERAVMLEALEKLKPNLAALVDASIAQQPGAQASAASAAQKTQAGDVMASATGAASVGTSSEATFVCRKCGHKLVGEEQFCGKCGMARGSDYEPPNMQSKVASLWHMQEAMRKKEAETGNGDSTLTDPKSIKLLSQSLVEPRTGSVHRSESQDLEALLVGSGLNSDPSESLAHLAIPTTDEDASRDHKENDHKKNDHEENDGEENSGKPERVADWSSAATARDFLERFANRPEGLARFWNTRRGDIYLAIAVILVGCVICWAILSNHSVGATGNQNSAAAHRKPAPDSDLSMFDRTLIRLGLAEAPVPPESKGNPDTQVWLDLQTALYYCPGEDLYGKTPKGRFSSQHDAQLDQFESASRKACN